MTREGGRATAGKYMLAHAASAQGIAAVETACGRPMVLNHLAVPAACFTHPEVPFPLSRPLQHRLLRCSGFPTAPFCPLLFFGWGGGRLHIDTVWKNLWILYFPVHAALFGSLLSLLCVFSERMVGLMGRKEGLHA